MKTRLAVIFGGRSVEHEVSVISAIQAIMSLNTEKYDITPVYMTKKGEMYVGDGIGDIESYKNIPGLLSKSERVIMINEGDSVFLTPYPQKRFGKHEIPVDIVFPIVHGTNVEDGTLQGYLKTLGVPFVGCDVTASAVGMDKYIMKTILKDNDIPVLDGKVFTLADYENIENMISRIEETIGYPAIVKPINLGSSVGISVAKTRDELVSSIDDSFRYATKVLVEHAITSLREINCAVLGDENQAEASECEEPMHTDGILSYEDKYIGGGKTKSGMEASGAGTKLQTGGAKGSSGMASLSRQIPADISPERREEIRTMAVKAFKALGCNGVARIDFMIDTDTDSLYFNEINTIPGSLSFYLWEPLGLPYTELLDRMIALALKRKRMEERLTFTFDVNILQNANLGGQGAKKL